MTAAAQKIVEEFEALEPAEQQRVLGRLLEIADKMLDYGDVTDEEMHAAADRTFLMYDAEEAEE